VQSLERQEFTLGGFFFDWQANQKPFTALTYERGVNECNLTEASPMHLRCAGVAQSFLPTLGVSPALGRNFLPEEDLPNGPKVALLTDGFWLSRFNRDRNVLNKTITIDDQPTRIVGVLPANFEMPRLQPADILLPAAMDVAAQHTVNSGIGYPMWAFARLKPGISIEQAKARMEPLFLHTQQWIPAQFRKEFHLAVRSVRDRQMQEAYAAAWILLAAVLAVLLIATANVASLFSARTAARQRELAVRAALGASRSRILRQTLTESLLLALAGAAAGCALAAILLRIFVALAPTGVPFLAQAHLDLRVVLFSLVIALGCSVFFGILASLDRPHPSALTARATSGSAHLRLRQGLVATQIAVSVVLVAGALLLLKSFQNLERQKLGMATGNVISVQLSLNWNRYKTGAAYREFYLRAEAALRRLPGVTAVAITNSVPPDDKSWHDSIRYDSINVQGQPRPALSVGGTVVSRAVTPDYFRALQIPIVAGRAFTEDEREAGTNLLILSKLLAGRLFPRGDAVGQRIQFASYRPYYVLDGPIYTVAGVAGDVKNAGLAGQDDPECYFLRTNNGSWNGHYLFLVQTTLPASVMTSSIQTQIAQVDPMTPIDVESLDALVRRLADRPRFETALLGFFAFTGLTMAVIGLYGVITFLAAQRTQEIGVRMALGADRGDILRLVAGEGLRLIAIGGTVGIAVSLAVTQLLKSLLFGIDPRDPAALLSAIGALAITAMAATLIPARRAMRVEPVEALRCE
jgi:putative ABC transport system permease protein